MSHTEEIKDFTKKAMVGLAIMGNPSMNYAGGILVGTSDLEIKCGLYFYLKSKSAIYMNDLEIPEITLALERFKDFIRREIKHLFEEHSEYKKLKLLEKLQTTNQPHASGTVAEIASKYGLSKSEVRCRKLDGTLDSFLQIKELAIA